MQALAPQHLDRWRLDLVTPEAPLPMFPPAEDLAPRGCNSAGMYTAGGMYALPVTVAGTPVRCSGDTARLGEMQRRLGEIQRRYRGDIGEIQGRLGRY